MPSASTTHLRPASRKRIANSEVMSVARDLSSKRADMKATSLQPGTLATYASADAYFLEFCTVLEICFVTFGALESKGGLPPEEEDEVFELFVIYVVHYPRVANKTLNTADYATNTLSGVRHCCRARHNGRRPGTRADDQYGINSVLRALRKVAPSGVRPPRLPIFQIHLHAIRRILDLRGNGRHRVLWALWLTLWQTVCRCGDLLRRKYRSSTPWDPRWDCHRGRFALEPVPASERGRHNIAFRAIVRLPPGKTDPSGERKLTKTVLVDTHPDALNCGVAIADMLEKDPLRPGETDEGTPLFRDPTTGAEITYSAAKRELKSLLHAAGYPTLASGMHSLRIGGGTLGTHYKGDFVGGCMGHWLGPSKFDYFFAMRDDCEEAALAMGRGLAGPLADPSGAARHRHRRQRR